MKISLLFVVFILSSCSVFKARKLSRDVSENAKKICLSGNGKGRLEVQDQKYVFSYESLMEEELARWTLILDFPLHNQEELKLDWSKANKVEFTTSIEEKILKENRHVNPTQLDKYIQNLGSFLKEVIDLANSKQVKSAYSWEIKQKSFVAVSKNKAFIAEFKQLTSQNYFGLMSLSYQIEDEQSYKMDFVVRNCAE